MTKYLDETGCKHLVSKIKSTTANVFKYYETNIKLACEVTKYENKDNNWQRTTLTCAIPDGILALLDNKTFLVIYALAYVKTSYEGGSATQAYRGGCRLLLFGEYQRYASYISSRGVTLLNPVDGFVWLGSSGSINCSFTGRLNYDSDSTYSQVQYISSGRFILTGIISASDIDVSSLTTD